jgi:hypothetical protein
MTTAVDRSTGETSSTLYFFYGPAPDLRFAPAVLTNCSTGGGAITSCQRDFSLQAMDHSFADSPGSLCFRPPSSPGALSFGRFVHHDRHADDHPLNSFAQGQ